jgi:hypothetical protein
MIDDTEKGISNTRKSIEFAGEKLADDFIQRFISCQYTYLDEP